MTRRNGGPVQYAVVDPGHIAQVAVLPAFVVSRDKCTRAAAGLAATAVSPHLVVASVTCECRVVRRLLRCRVDGGLRSTLRLRILARRHRTPHRNSCHGQDESKTPLGPKSQNGFDASTAAYVQRIGVADRRHHGAEGCLAEGAGVRHSHDSVLHQPWRETSVREPPARARTREAYSAAAAAVGGIVEGDVSDDTPSVVYSGWRRGRP